MELSKVNEWIHRLLPLVRDALDDPGVMPERNAQAFANTQAKRKAGREVIIDRTVRRRQRPKSPEKQILHYSGKKKTHADKNLAIGERKSKRVSYLSSTDTGTAHDKKIADHENITYAKKTIVHQDTGFQGYQPDVASIRQPKKSRVGESRPALTSARIVRSRVCEFASNMLFVASNDAVSPKISFTAVKSLFRKTSFL